MKKATKIKRTYRLKHETIEKLEKIAKDNECTNTDVIEFLINNYNIKGDE